jgi:hypothetical protein
LEGPAAWIGAAVVKSWHKKPPSTEADGGRNREEAEPHCSEQSNEPQTNVGKPYRSPAKCGRLG